MRKDACPLFIFVEGESRVRPVPVLMYHHVNPHSGDIVTVTPEIFEGQMAYLHKSGYKTLKIDELLSYIHGDLPLKQKAVVITFDDGWLDNYLYAFPVLKKYAINAAIFITTGWIDKASEKQSGTFQNMPTHRESKQLIAKGDEQKVMLNWELIEEMSVSGLVEFYSHTKNHKKCDRLPGKELLEELNESKKVIEERLGKVCPYLCWPYGKYNDTALHIAKDVGYRAIFTTKHGVVKPGSDPLKIKRIVIKDNVAWFKKRMLIYTSSMLSMVYLKMKKK